MKKSFCVKNIFSRFPLIADTKTERRKKGLVVLYHVLFRICLQIIFCIKSKKGREIEKSNLEPSIMEIHNPEAQKWEISTIKLKEHYSRFGFLSVNP